MIQERSVIAQLLFALGLLYLSVVCTPALSQTGAASISGHVVSETGRSLRALVALRSANGAVQQGVTDVGGFFSFAQLPAGTYTFCARIPAEQFPRPDQPYLDTCMWEQPQNPVEVAAGKTVGGVQVTVPEAVLLEVRVDDPEHLLPQATVPQLAQTLDTQLELIVRQPSRPPWRIPFLSQDSTGRNYYLVVPTETALLLTARSSQAKLNHENGQPVQGDINLKAPKGSALNPFKFTIHHN